MTALIYWFRNDLRLHDNPAFAHACAQSDAVLPVYCLGAASAVHNGDARWGVMQASTLRQRVLLDSLLDLHRQLQQLGSGLTVFAGTPVQVLPTLARLLGIHEVHAEAIAATHEQDEVQALQQSGCTVTTSWQSTLFNAADLPAGVAGLPQVYTPFRQALLASGSRACAPLAAPDRLPPLPQAAHGLATVDLARQRAELGPLEPDPRSSLPVLDGAFVGGETTALAHLGRYFGGDLPRHYKATRNQLNGVDFSSKCSAWLASGALSVRQLAQALQRYQTAHGSTEGGEWLWRELLWREHFRWLHVQHGEKLFRYRGLCDKVPALHHDPALFARWCLGRTGEPLVDAAMHELLASGYLSNRLRQVVASYLIHELHGDWRAGAAWFEAQLIDYDVYNNQGNWLYIAGMGTDPRGGRHFDVAKQTREHDPDGRYRQLWQQV